jgi:Calcineurin-like phosphoesterase
MPDRNLMESPGRPSLEQRGKGARERVNWPMLWRSTVLTRRIFAAVLVAFAGGGALACGGSPLPPLEPAASPTVDSGGPIIVLGDTQRTTWGERVLFGREQNEQARRALVRKIASEEAPAFIVHLGDMVEAGGVAENWLYFDRLMSPLTARKIPILPVIGNHDHWGDDREANRQLQARFPQLGVGGYYSMQYEELGLVWLDSNLEGAAAAAQTRWLEQALRAFELNPGVRGTLIFCHHPAYTNGKARYGEPYVQGDVLPRLFAARKTMALLSGHVHGYERFVAQGRQFIVSGGAGGPRVEYHLPPDAPYVAAYTTETEAPRPFHYVAIERTHDGLAFTVKCLNLIGECPRGILETFSAHFP